MGEMKKFYFKLLNNGVLSLSLGYLVGNELSFTLWQLTYKLFEKSNDLSYLEFTKLHKYMESLVIFSTVILFWAGLTTLSLLEETIELKRQMIKQKLIEECAPRDLESIRKSN